MKIIIFAFLLFLPVWINAQVACCDTLPFTIYDSIGEKDDFLVSDTVFPDWKNLENKVVENAAASIDTSRWTREIKELVAQWKEEHFVSDDGDEHEYYAIIKKDTGYFIKKLKGKVNYLFGEVGGGYKIEKVVVAGEPVDGELYCLFEKSVELKEKQINIRYIHPKPKLKPRFGVLQNARGELWDVNVLAGFSFKQEKYELHHTADVALNGFTYTGLGTIQPIYFNMDLTLFNKENNQHQLLFKFPHSAEYNISEIAYGDIDSDSKLDIIYEMTNEWCIRRIFFLSGQAAGEPDAMLKYTGQTEVDCWYP